MLIQIISSNYHKLIISTKIISRTFLKQQSICSLLNFKNLAVLLLIIPGFLGTAFGHTINSVEEYRLKIGWMNEPVVSEETNGIELFVVLSNLD